MDITKPSPKRQKIYPIFHFIPGDPNSPTAKRKDGKKHPMNTTPNSKNAKYFFQKAIENKNLYHIGIATHAYADTWAHQNFVGMEDKFNALPMWGILPNIGHADARHEPDKIDNTWTDRRLVDENEKVYNNDRLLDAAEQIYYSYCKYNNPASDSNEMTKRWNKLKERLKDAMDDSYFWGADERARMKAYKNICADIPEYKEKEWRYNAVKKEPVEEDLFDRYWGKNNFLDSHWYKFQEAVKEHRDLSLKRLKPVYKKVGLQI